ncbi:MAG: alpha/beta hydrolase [Bacteroidales bacterium]|jgi:dienelactone hydrolase|nr:alpha/beta hydrolase [Bacteroidales bacterium]
MMHAIVKLPLLSLAIAVSAPVFAQKKVTFTTADSLTVTADMYRVDKYAPYIVLLHGENSSRGEYRDIAPKLQKLGFNCLAVDLRHGKECNFVRNETVKEQWQKNGIQAVMLDCEKDITAAIDYIAAIAINKRCILLGSNFSASLAMKTARHNRQVTGVVAFSPGEYFGPSIAVKDWFDGFDHLLLVAATQRETPFVAELLQDIPADLLTRFQPATGNGQQGAPALWKNDSTSDEYWISLMLFLNKVKEKTY